MFMRSEPSPYTSSQCRKVYFEQLSTNSEYIKRLKHVHVRMNKNTRMKGIAKFKMFILQTKNTSNIDELIDIFYKTTFSREPYSDKKVIQNKVFYILFFSAKKCLFVMEKYFYRINPEDLSMYT